jgi:hypothetical protein
LGNFQRASEGEADSQLINIGMENTVHETDTRRLVRVTVRQLDVDLPNAALKGSYRERLACRVFTLAEALKV